MASSCQFNWKRLYSVLSARIGRIDAVRRAGMKPAIKALSTRSSFVMKTALSCANRVKTLSCFCHCSLSLRR
jgi:hypothetical protein